MTVGDRIREARKAKGLTQKALGEACGIAEPTIRRYELGKLNPKYETLEKIAGALGLSAADLKRTEVGYYPMSQWAEKYPYLYRMFQLEYSRDPGQTTLYKTAEEYEQFVDPDTMEFFDTLESLSLVQDFVAALGIVPIYAGDEPKSHTIGLFNQRTEKVYVIPFEQYQEGQIDILRQTLHRLSKLFDQALECISFAEAKKRGYYVFLSQQPQETFTPPDSETATPEDK